MNEEGQKGGWGGGCSNVRGGGRDGAEGRQFRVRVVVLLGVMDVGKGRMSTNRIQLCRGKIWCEDLRVEVGRDGFTEYLKWWGLWERGGGGVSCS